MRYLILIIFFFLSCAGARDGQDELELTHTTLEACDCAEWSVPEGTKVLEQDREKPEERLVFIEPADISLTLPDTLGFEGDVIRFTGQFHPKEGYPKGYVNPERDLRKAPVFRYTKYEVVKSIYSE